ncbi:MAG: helix-turn-helix domain-containing protein [Phycisphaeraceae bacterium]|nr:helix-turn-helix domain-containing protein [Phycisphaeraceae bacterium]
MNDHQIVKLGGVEFVVMERSAFERLATKAKAADLPAMPKPDKDGNYPAVEYARASLARKIVHQRAELGLTQKELAKLAGLPVENLCRIERGNVSPRLGTLAKIERALEQARANVKGKRHGKRGQ